MIPLQFPRAASSSGPLARHDIQELRSLGFARLDTGARRKVDRRMNRRDFLLKGGAAAAGLAAVGAAGDAALRAPVSQAQAPQDGAGQAPVPTAGAAPSLPPPLGKGAYVTRMESARALMREVKADALIEMPGTNLTYLTGLKLGRSERLIAFVLPLEGPPVLLGPMFERELLASSPAGLEDIRTWEEQEDPFEQLEKILRIFLRQQA